jgi:hypothetical protein
MQDHDEARHAALRWLAYQLAWERRLEVLRRGHDGPTMKDRPAA